MDSESVCYLPEPADLDVVLARLEVAHVVLRRPDHAGQHRLGDILAPPFGANGGAEPHLPVFKIVHVGSFIEHRRLDIVCAL